MPMTLPERLYALTQLGAYLQTADEALHQVLQTTEQYNRWLTRANSQQALDNFAQHFLQRKALDTWTAQYPALQQ